MGTFAVLTVLIVTTGFVIRKLYRDRKNGVSLHCGMKCDRCGGCTSCKKADK